MSIALSSALNFAILLFPGPSSNATTRRTDSCSGRRIGRPEAEQTSTPAMAQQGGKLSQSFHVKYFLRFTFTAIAKFKPFWIYIILLLKQL